jgi:hypothetical protein
MIKAVFLLGKGTDVMKDWDGSSSKRRRVLGKDRSFNGFKAVEGLIYDRKSETKKSFYFFPIKNESEISGILNFLNIKKKEAVTVVSIQDKEISERIIESNRNKRYHYINSYGWIFYLREGVKEQIINEFISSFFEEVISEKLIVAIERNCLETLKRMKAGTRYFQ